MAVSGDDAAVPQPAPPELGFEDVRRIYGPIRSLSPAEAAVPRRDVPALREWLRDYHLWDTCDGALRYLSADVVVPIDHEQLRVRRDACSPSIALTEPPRHPWLDRLGPLG